MAFTFANLFADVKGSRYFQVWVAAWIAFFIVFIIGLANISAISGYTANAPNYKNYRIWYQDAAPVGIPWPLIGFYPNNASVQVSSFTCNTEDQHDIPRKMNVPFNGRTINIMEPSKFLAMPRYNDLYCFVILANTGVREQDYGTTWVFVDSGIFQPDAEFIQVDSKKAATIFLTKTLFETAAGPVLTFWNPTLYQMPLHENITYYDAIEIAISVFDFTVTHYLEYNNYVGWQAYADIGGILFASYTFHAIFMFIIGLFLQNDSRLLNPLVSLSGGASTTAVNEGPSAGSSLLGGRGYDTVA